MSFYDRLARAIDGQNSLLCVGIDPDPGRLPLGELDSRDPLYDFCRAVVTSTIDFAAAYKFNLAFFEAWGGSGWDALYRVLSDIPEPIVTIADGKRGDIGNSSRQYADSLFTRFDFTAATVNPYMGFDSVEPFLRDPERGAFVLCRTSNPGATDLQGLEIDGEPLYLKVARLASSWNSRKNVGLVVGATAPRELEMVGKTVPELPLLVPGIGAQGGDLESTLGAGIGSGERRLLLINSSRSIIFASSGPDFAAAARRAARDLRDEINGVLDGLSG